MNDPLSELKRLNIIMSSRKFINMQYAEKKELKKEQQKLLEILIRKEIREHIEPILTENDFDKDIRIFNDGEFGINVEFVEYWSEIDTMQSSSSQSLTSEPPSLVEENLGNNIKNQEECEVEEEVLPIFEHKLDWSPFCYGFTIDKKYHGNIFDVLGKEIQKGESVECSLFIDNKAFCVKFDSPNIPGSKRVRLLYKSKNNNPGVYLQDVFHETYRYLKQEKELYGGRCQIKLPAHLQGTLSIYRTDEPLTFKMTYKKTN